jgi:hypothetical protein
MAISGYTDAWVTSHDTLRFNWWQIEQSIAGNYTKIGWNTQLISDSYGKISSTASKSWNNTVNGAYYEGTNTVGIGNNTTKTLTSGETIIYHNNDGSKQFSYSFNQYFGITFSGASIGTVSGSGSATLNTIPRKSTLSVSNGTIGVTNGSTITINRASSGFTHSVYCQFGNILIQITSKDTRVSIPWTIPTEFYTQIPNGREGYGSVWCDTYNGDTLIGTSDPVRLIAYVDEETSKPTLNPAAFVAPEDELTIELTGNNSTIIKGYSDVMVSAGEAARNSARITSTSITCGNKVLNSYYNNNDEYITAYGKLEDVESPIFVSKTTDSRGYSVDQKITLSFVEYVKLTCGFDHEIAFSKNSEDKIDIILTIKGKYFNGSFGKESNILNVGYNYKIDDGDWLEETIYAEQSSIELNGNEYSWTVTIPNLDYKSTYTFTCVAHDRLMSVNARDYAIKALPVFDWGENDFNFNVPVHGKGGFTYDIPIRHGDVDTMLTSGIYYMSTSATNKPGEGYNGWLEVYTPVGGGDYVYQKYTDYLGSKYERWRNAGIWGSWISDKNIIVEEGFWIAGVTGTATFCRRGNITTLTLRAKLSSDPIKEAGSALLGIPSAFAPNPSQVTVDVSTHMLWGRGGHLSGLVGSLSIYDVTSVLIFYDFKNTGIADNWTLGASMTWMN